MSEEEKERILKLYDKQLKKMIYSKSQFKDAFTSCVICFDEFHSNTEIRETECNHLFHPQCLLGWIKQKMPTPDCPTCRMEFKLKRQTEDPQIAA